MKRFIIFGAILTIYSGITFYLGWNLKSWLQALQLFHFEALYWGSLFFIAFSFIFGRLHKNLNFLSIIGNYWMFILQYGLLISVALDLLFFLTPLKNIVILGFIGLIALSVLFLVGTFNAYSPVVKQLNITINKKGRPLTVVVASDFHLGVLSHKKHLQKFVDLSNKANPDIVLLAGDLVDDDPIHYIEQGMHTIMKGLSSTYGVYGVVGNHEYYGKKIPLLVEEMAASNVKMLLDETILIDNRFYVTGREDRTNKARQSLQSLKPDNDALPWFVMNHTPDDLLTPSDLGVDLHVSGHTHKGQMWPNNIITAKVFEHDYGYKLKNTMHTLVSSGFGFWGPPTRIGTRSELWVVKVQFSMS